MIKHTGVIPFQWFSRSALRHGPTDLRAGLTVAIVLIPQAMAYAMIAGMPPITGLYAAIVGLLIYAAWGGVYEVSLGPTALDALLIASSASLLIPQSNDDYVVLVVLLTFIAGLFQIICGALRFGYIVSFLASPVITGFSAAAAIIIIVNQLDNLFGISSISGQRLQDILPALLNQASQIHWPTTVVATASLVFLLLGQWLAPRFPTALAVVVLTTAAVWLFDLQDSGVSVIGDLAWGIPTIALPTQIEIDVVELGKAALTVAFVGFMGAIAVAKTYANKRHQRVDENRELQVLGLANIAGALVGSFAIGGSFSRSAVNANAGAKSLLSSIVCLLAVIIIVSLFAKLLHDTPVGCLASIVIVSVYRLLDINELLRLYRVSRKDAALLCIAFVATLLLGVVQGILLSVVISVAMILSRITLPPVVQFGIVDGRGENIFRNLAINKTAKTIDSVVMLRIEASLYFNNIDYVIAQIEKRIATRQDPITTLILDLGSVNEIDTSAQKALVGLIENFKDVEVDCHIVALKARIVAKLKLSGLAKTIGEDHFHYNKYQALEAIQRI